MTEYFMIFCSGVGALAAICGSVWSIMRLAMSPLRAEMASVKADIADFKEKVNAMEQRQADTEKALGEKLDQKLDALYAALNALKDLLADKYVKRDCCEKQFVHCSQLFGGGRPPAP